MKKPKKKRKPTQAFSGDVELEPLQIIILDQPQEMSMIFSFSNRALKMLKSGRELEKVFLKDNKQCRLTFMHRDIYDETYRKVVEMKQRHIAQKAKEEADAAEATEPAASDENKVE